MLEVVALDERRRAEWSRISGLSEIEANPGDGAYGRHYFSVVYGGRRKDVCFAIADGGEPLLLVIASVGEGEIDWFGRPVQLFSRLDLPAGQAAAAIRHAFVHLDALAQRHGVAKVRVWDKNLMGALSDLGKECLNRQASGALNLHAFADLSGGEAALRKGLRKSFRSLINWGRRNLTIELVGRDNASHELFDRYQAFHMKIAGRETRPQASWDAMYDHIVAGGGELVLGFLNGGLVSGTLVLYGASVASYASGVYDRALFARPLAHWPLWLSMLRSGENGLKTFDIGALPQANGTSEKESNIGYFKRGFATRIATWIEWTWRPALSNHSVALEDVAVELAP
jgi:Acetyltransferase (GNAT) domain